MSLQRTVWNRLEAWRDNPDHRALLIDGARQVGKTYLVREFAAARYDVFLEINFLETPSAVRVFDGDLDADTIITNLSVYSPRPFIPGRTLIFLDEIQECPRARAAIKFLVDDGRFDYIESGSLLGISYKKVPSYPVGYEEQLTMRPLTLQEFFQANGIQQQILEQVGECFINRTDVPVPIHERLLKLFRYYMIVGGMPAAVSTFIATHDLRATLHIQQDILALYRQDISKYASNKMHVRAILDAIPSQLDKKNKRFILADLAKTARMERYASDFMWLADAGVTLPCYNVRDPSCPLAINEQRNLMKVFLNDVGLLSAAGLGTTQQAILEGEIGINWGSFLENLVAQELVAHDFRPYYYDKAKIGGIDFLIQRGNEIVPIEAKSGNDFTRHAALNNLMAVEEWHLRHAIVLCGGNVSRHPDNDAITYMPWYMAMYLEQPQVRHPIVTDL